jgi:hypothetical protein
MGIKIYVASSWRNDFQPLVVERLRVLGFDPYDFKNPSPGEHGFSWKEIEPDYSNWTTEQYIGILDHPISERGFGLDWQAMQNAAACVLVLPSGRSAHIEAGYFVGARRPLFIYIPTPTTEPELMYKMASGGVHATAAGLFAAIQSQYQ